MNKKEKDPEKDTLKSDKRKEKDKVVAKISDQHYLIGSDELNKIVSMIRSKYNEVQGDPVQFAQYLMDINNNSLSKNEFLKAYVLWNGVIDANT